MITKDQTAQAIAKSAEAYEKAGVEAAFQAVRVVLLGHTLAALSVVFC